jgi:hypothetical protein
MGALWHLEVTPGVDAVFDEIGATYGGAETITLDLTISNVTKDAIITRQPKVNDAAPTVAHRRRTRCRTDPSGVLGRSTP